MVLGVCRRVLRDPHDAEDAFQATFLVLVRKAAVALGPRLARPLALPGGLPHAACARSAAARRRRHERRRGRGSRGRPGAAADDLDAVLHEEVARLPERYRAVVVSACSKGCPTSRRRHRLGWPVGTVKSRLARGRARLKRSLPGAAWPRTIAVAAATALPPKLAEAALKSALRYASPARKPPRSRLRSSL